MPAFAAGRAPIPGSACGGNGIDPNGYPMGITNAWTWTGQASDGGIVNGMFCNGSTWQGVINFQSSGNVGIGTASPTALLNLQESSASTLNPLFLAKDSNYGGHIAIDHYGALSYDDTLWLATDANLHLAALTTAANPLSLTSDGYGGSNDNIDLRPNGTGKVGIGTTSPAALLDVAGEIRTTGNTLICSSTTAGAIRYNSSSKAFDYCGGSTPAWTAFGGGSTAAGTTGQVQFNNNGVLFASSGFTFNSTTGALTVAGSESVTNGASGGTAITGTANNGAGLGVKGQTSSTTATATGVYGIASGGTGTTAGVYGESDSTTGYGGYFTVQTTASGPAAAVHGDTTSYNGFAGQFYEYSGTGVSYGVYSEVYSPNGYGFYSSAAQNYFNGKVGVGKPSPTVALDVAGDIHYSGSLTDVSDRRMKHSIQPLPDQLGRLERLQPVSYVKNEDPKHRTQFGFIAQDVQPIYPDLVETDPTGLRSMDYVGLISPIVAGMQEQQEEIRALWIMLAVTASVALAACVAFLWCFLQLRGRPRPA